MTAKCRVYQDPTGTWWLHVPPRLLQGRETGVYHRRTWREVIKLMDDLIGRYHAHNRYHRVYPQLVPR